MFGEETLKKNEELEKKWREHLLKRYQGKEFKSTSLSGIEVKSVYDIKDVENIQYEDIGLPGEYPYTRGIYPIHYQYQPWMNEQIIGYGIPSHLRDRIKLLREEGGAQGYFGREAFNLIFDQATQSGYDPDDPVAMGRIGDTGVSVCKAKDFEVLFEGTDLNKTNVVFVANNSSPTILALYIAAAERMGVAQKNLRGNLTNYLYCKFFQDCESFPPKSAFKIMREVIKYCTRNIPGWNTLTITEHNMKEAGASQVQALAFSLAVSIATTEECIKAGLKPDDFIPRFGFHVEFGENFFEDIAKVRALRRMYAKINKERFGCTNPKSLQARIHGQTAGVTMTVQQPLNNLIRNSLHTLSMILAGVNGTQVDAYDEALGEPTEEAVTLSFRTQQIIYHETGITSVSDPLAGSYYLEWLTSEIERQAGEILEAIDKQGGFVKCWENGWLKRKITESAFKWRQKVESGEKVIVGVNKYFSDNDHGVEVFKPHPDTEKMAAEDVIKHRRERDNEKCRAALENLHAEAVKVEQSDTEGNLMEALVGAAKADATLGEMQAVLREVFGAI